MRDTHSNNFPLDPQANPASAPHAVSDFGVIQVIRGAEIDGADGVGHHHGIFEYHAPRYPLVCGYSRQPLLDACRQLKSLYGLTGERAGLFREGRDTPDISCQVEVGAATTVKERDRGAMGFEKFKAWDPAPAMIPAAMTAVSAPKVLGGGPRPINSMQAAFLEAAKHRVTRDPSGQVVLPTGRADVAELAQVLGALERVR